MGLLKTVGKVVASPVTLGLIAAKDPTIRTAAAAAAGFAVGGPAGAAAAATAAGAINSAEQGKKAGKIANKGLAMQEDQSKAFAEYQKKLNKQLGADEAKTQSLLAKGGRGKIKGGVFGPVSETPKGPQATLG